MMVVHLLHYYYNIFIKKEIMSKEFYKNTYHTIDSYEPKDQSDSPNCPESQECNLWNSLRLATKRKINK